ncbi:DUF7144 family membrane protein [Streptomyces sp. NBC_01210]|uniref:DUF7144 family membrane protein n=1 Tax=Streptomyces sp. NBC_01210 TaxID=2903774 RepID=UPI003FA3CCEF
MSQDQPVGSPMNMEPPMDRGTPMYKGPPPGEPNSGWVTGGLVFAAVLMLCGGVLAALQGIAAIAEDDVYGRLGNYVYGMSLTGWGWIHLILGICVAITGAGLFKAATWARFAGIFLAAISLVAQFLFLPYAPVWSVIMIAIDLFIIWTLAVYHSTEPRPASA